MLYFVLAKKIQTKRGQLFYSIPHRKWMADPKWESSQADVRQPILVKPGELHPSDASFRHKASLLGLLFIEEAPV